MNEVNTNLVSRFMAVQKFLNEEMEPPTTLAWTYLFFSQFVWGQIAKNYPAECGVKDKSGQAINGLVNADLKKISELGLKQNASSGVSRETLKTYKVYTLVPTSLMAAVSRLFHEVSYSACERDGRLGNPA